MSKGWEKYLKRLQPKSKHKLLETLKRLEQGNISGLDIKPLKNSNGLYRCRAGTIRIIFKRIKEEIIIVDIGPRGGVYK